MIDNIKITKNLDQIPLVMESQMLEAVPFLGLSFHPYRTRSNRIGYEADHLNLKLRVYESGRLVIQNSITRYYKGNNYTNLSFGELNLAFYQLEKELGISLKDAVIRKMEVGIVLNIDPIKELNSWQTFNSKHFFPMHKNGKEYGKQFENSVYKIKGYNKGYEMQLNSGKRNSINMLRCEVEYGKLSYLNKQKDILPIKTVSNLLDHQTLHNLVFHTSDKFNSIYRNPNLDELATRQFRAIMTFQNPEMQRGFQKNKPEAFKKDRAIYNKLQSTVNSQLNTLLWKQFSELLSN